MEHGRAPGLSARTVVEVWALYGHTVLDVRHLARERYTIGESHAAALVVPPAGLPDATSFALVQGRTLHFTASMHGEVTDRGETFSLRALARSGRACVRGSSHSYRLGPNARCRVEHGAVTFLVNVVPTGDPLSIPVHSRPRSWAFATRSLLLFVSLLLASYLADPSEDAPEVGIDTQPTQDVVVAFAHRLAPGGSAAGPAGFGETPGARPSPDSGGRGGVSERARGLGGGDDPSSDTRRSRSRHRRPEGANGHSDGAGGAPIDGPSGAARASAIRPRIDGATRCGTLDVLAVEASSTTPSWQLMRAGPCSAQSPGAIPQMARNFDPDRMPSQAGILGLAVTAGDEGRAPSSTDGPAFGVAGTGLVDGPSRRAHVQGGSTEKTPRVRQAKAKIRGDLDPHIIRRIVRTNIDEVRHCHARGLARRPEISGRIAIAFTIGARGRVSRSAVRSSSLGDTRVERCIGAAVRRWRFPKPRDGLDVAVTLPFILIAG